MAEYTWRTLVVTRREYSIPTPIAAGEVLKMINRINADLTSLKEQGVPWTDADDFVTVEARDDEIVYWFVVPEGKALQ